MSKRGKIILIILAIIAAACAGYLIYHFVSLAKANNDSEELLEKVSIETVAPVQSTTGAAEESTETETTTAAYESPIDFTELQSINEEIHAWITVDNTSINYPVAQHAGESGTYSENYYYLDTNYDNTYSEYGTLFTTTENATDMSDPITVIYGHNRSRFEELKLYRDETYWDEHRYIHVYTPTEELTYKIWAAVVHSDDFLANLYDLKTTEGVESFITGVLQINDLNSHVDESMTVTGDDRLVVLSTCVPEDSSKRYLVVGVLQTDAEK